jgi:hypothetical protein
MYNVSRGDDASQVNKRRSSRASMQGGLPRDDRALPIWEDVLFSACFSPLSLSASAVKAIQRVSKRGTACSEHVPAFRTLLVYWVMEDFK